VFYVNFEFQLNINIANLEPLSNFKFYCLFGQQCNPNNVVENMNQTTMRDEG
jgi:hypothetical protein